MALHGYGKLLRMSSDCLLVAATPGLHQAVITIVTDLLEKKKVRPNAFALDLPCGAGSMTTSLEGLGLTAVASDLELHENFQGRTSSFVQADANHRLPFASCCFDLVVSIEGIEHFENPSAFVREVERILSPGC
jgi:ubiquinone/menaquinone biosynthesis C-methylase UbiE